MIWYITGMTSYTVYDLCETKNTMQCLSQPPARPLSQYSSLVSFSLSPSPPPPPLFTIAPLSPPSPPRPSSPLRQSFSCTSCHIVTSILSLPLSFLSLSPGPSIRPQSLQLSPSPNPPPLPPSPFFIFFIAGLQGPESCGHLFPTNHLFDLVPCS
jgi:hypothetical protein